MRNVLEWIRNNRSRSKGDNLPKAGFSELLNILLNNFVSVAFKNLTNKTSILLKIEVVRTKITFKGKKGAPPIVSNIQTARQNLFQHHNIPGERFSVRLCILLLSASCYKNGSKWAEWALQVKLNHTDSICGASACVFMPRIKRPGIILICVYMKNAFVRSNTFNLAPKIC